jgi:hypothetical protein
VKVFRLHMASTNRFVDRRQQGFDSPQSIGDRTRCKAQAQQSKLLDRAVSRSL